MRLQGQDNVPFLVRLQGQDNVPFLVRLLLLVLCRLCFGLVEMAVGLRPFNRLQLRPPYDGTRCVRPHWS
jgi:hypothetical protein